MNLDNIMLLEHRRHLPRVSGDTHALASGETNCKIKEKYDKEQTGLILLVFCDQKVLSAKTFNEKSLLLYTKNIAHTAYSIKING